MQVFNTIGTVIREFVLRSYFNCTNMPVYRHLDELNAFAHASPEVHKSMAERKLERSINHAVERVPYYRDRGYEILSDFPVLTKQIILDNFTSLIADTFKEADGREIYTSGSTGRRLKVLYDRLEHGWRTATVWYGLSLPSQIGGDATPVFSGVVYLGGEPDTSGGLLLNARRKLRDRFLTQKIFGCYNLTKEKALNIYTEIAKGRPAIVLGYAGNLERFAGYVTELGLPKLKVKKVISTAEQLTPSVLDLIRMCFEAPVRERYGCGEAGGIATQCEHGTWHIFSPHIYPEVLLDDGTISSSGTGRLLISKLNNRIMPLVRYDVEDRIEIAGKDEPQCPCGRSLPVIKQLIGREIDLINFDNGETMHGLCVAETLQGIPVKEYVFVQTDHDSATFYIVPRPGFSDDWLRKIESNVQERFDCKLNVLIKIIEEIPTEIAYPFGNSKRLQVYNLWRRRETS
jgi:phenylacetate-CoA ligase